MDYRNQSRRNCATLRSTRIRKARGAVQPVDNDRQVLQPGQGIAAGQERRCHGDRPNTPPPVLLRASSPDMSMTLQASVMSVTTAVAPPAESRNALETLSISGAGLTSNQSLGRQPIGCRFVVYLLLGVLPVAMIPSRLSIRTGFCPSRRVAAPAVAAYVYRQACNRSPSGSQAAGVLSCAG